MSQSKKELRPLLLAKRKALKCSPANAALNGRLCSTLAAWLANRNYASVGLFWPIAGEPDVRAPCIDYAGQRPGTRLYLPATQGKDMEFRLWHPQVPLSRGPFGIPTPTERIIGTPDLLIIPCVAADDSGHRLGYGGGFYDRYLARIEPKPFRLGVCLSAFAHADFTADPFDEPLNALATEEQIRIFRF